MSQRSFPTFTTPVRGHAFAGIPPGASALVRGVTVELVREPANPRDRFAVAVWATAGATPGWRVGYLERAVAARLAPRIDDGAHLLARFDGWMSEPRGRWLRPIIRISGVDRVLPPSALPASTSEHGLDGHEAPGGQHPLDDRVVHAA